MFCSFAVCHFTHLLSNLINNHPMFILIPNKYLSIPNEKGKYGKGSKNSCENYLFKDYRLKSVMTIWILALRKNSFG